MTNALYLQEGDSGTTVSLLTGTLKLRMGTWQMRAPEPTGEWKDQPYGAQYTFKNYPRVTETFDLFAVNTAANIRTGVKAIEDLLEKARYWHTSIASHSSPIWLVARSEGETARRALVYGGALRFSTLGGASPLLEGNGINAQLVIQRHPLWENLASQDFSQASVNTLGGKFAPTTAAPGTAPGRIQSCGVAPTGGAIIGRFWLGARETGAGTADFKSVWECESAWHKGTDTTLSGVSGASPSGSTNNMLTCSFATVSANAERMTIKVSDVVSGNALHSVGRYVVLLRTRVASGVNVVFQLRLGFMGNTDSRNRIVNTVYHAGTSGTNWRLVELGAISIPANLNMSDSANSCGSTQLQLWVERVSASGSIDLDCLVLIPADHYVKCDGINNMYYPEAVVINSLPNEIQWAHWYTTGAQATVDLLPASWYYPVSNGLVVFAAESSTGGGLTNVADISFYTRPRWLSYRTT